MITRLKAGYNSQKLGIRQKWNKTNSVLIIKSKNWRKTIYNHLISTI